MLGRTLELKPDAPSLSTRRAKPEKSSRNQCACSAPHQLQQQLTRRLRTFSAVMGGRLSALRRSESDTQQGGSLRFVGGGSRWMTPTMRLVVRGPSTIG